MEKKIFWDFSGALTSFSGSELSVITSLSAFKFNPGQVALRITFLFDFTIYAQKKEIFYKRQATGERKSSIRDSVALQSRLLRAGIRKKQRHPVH